MRRRNVHGRDGRGREENRSAEDEEEGDKDCPSNHGGRLSAAMQGSLHNRCLLSSKDALKSALKFFRCGKIALSRRDIFKNTIWSGGFPSYSQVMTRES